jgi:hypothetical protein
VQAFQKRCKIVPILLLITMLFVITATDVGGMTPTESSAFALDNTASFDNAISLTTTNYRPKRTCAATRRMNASLTLFATEVLRVGADIFRPFVI